MEKVTEAMKRTNHWRIYERYQAIYLYLQGVHVKKIAALFNRNPQTVKGYKKAYDQKGLLGLEINHSPGRLFG